MTSLDALETTFLGERREVQRTLTFLTQISSDGKCNSRVAETFYETICENEFSGVNQNKAS